MIKSVIRYDEIDPRKVYNISETARILGKHRGTINNYIKRGLIEVSLVALHPKRGQEGSSLYRSGVSGKEIQRVYYKL